MEQNPAPAPAPTAADRVSEDGLKRLIYFEKQRENQIIVSENSAKFHHFVRETKASFKETTWHRQGLHSPSWTKDEARLDIQVAKDSLPRALRLMDALIKAFENRGHKVVAETREYHKDVIFLILGEQFSFRLREKTKMVRISESERKNNTYCNRVKYEPTGALELQLRRKQTGFAESTWKDSKTTKLEEQLNSVMIELIVAVEKERNWRLQQEVSAKQRRVDEANRWQQEQERRKEEQKINELNQMVQNWHQADRIRAFMDDVRARVQRRKGPIENGSDLDKWITWALKYADTIDPLGVRDNGQPVTSGTDDWSRPGHPR